MTILIGEVTVAGDTIKLLPPAQFGSVQAVRLSNLNDAYPILVTSITGIGQGTQYLFPNQQNVYPTQNVSTVPTCTPVTADTVANAAANLYVEWSTEPQADFVGVYPAQLSVPANVVAEAIFAAGVPNVLTETILEPNYLIGVSNSGGTGNGYQLDVHSYATVTFTASNATSAFTSQTGWEVFYIFANPDGGGGALTDYVSGYIDVGPQVDAPGGTPPSFSLPVLGYYLSIQITTSADVPDATDGSWVVSGSNRVTESIWTSNQTAIGGIQQMANGVSAVTFTDGESYDLGICGFSGLATVEFYIANTTDVKGIFRLYDYSGTGGVTDTGNFIEVADSTEMHDDSSGTNLVVYKNIYLPTSAVTAVFRCTATGTADQVGMRINTAPLAN